MKTKSETYQEVEQREFGRLVKDRIFRNGAMPCGILIALLAIHLSTPMGQPLQAGIFIIGTLVTALGLIGEAILWARHQIDKAPGDLADWQIAKLGEKGVIVPFDHNLIEPNSYDVRIGTKYARILPSGDLEEFETEEAILGPGEFLLAHTIETFAFPNHIKGILQGKSSWARLAVFVEAAGLFDAGFEGTAVLELYNCGKHAVKLRKGEKIAQMSFHRSLPAALPYGTERGSHYQGQEGAQSSWLGKADRIVPHTKE